MSATLNMLFFGGGGETERNQQQVGVSAIASGPSPQDHPSSSLTQPHNQTKPRGPNEAHHKPTPDSQLEHPVPPGYAGALADQDRPAAALWVADLCKHDADEDALHQQACGGECVCVVDGWWGGRGGGAAFTNGKDHRHCFVEAAHHSPVKQWPPTSAAGSQQSPMACVP